VEVVRVQRGDEDTVLKAGHLFDGTPAREWATSFLSEPTHHLFLAFDAEVPVGFVSGVETTHPDKGTEMFLYELGVDEGHRRRGVATALVEALAGLARERGCYGMWVATEPDNEAALATYARAGADAPEPCVTLTWTFEQR
jgi:ribosomal protein S18 acetylase RimI-like enzyme